MPKKKSKKRSKSKRSKKSRKVQKQQTNVWKYTSFVLAAFFLLSVFTQGFTNFPELFPKGNQEMGPRDGAVLMEEFSDFECPFCGRASSTVKRLRDEYGDQLEFEYKHFPLTNIHPNAQKAAEASECARDQGEFDNYHDLLFQNQNALDVNSLKSYASQLGLDTSEFNDCLDSGEKLSVVAEDFQEGQQRGVSGTPTFFINGQKLVGAQPYEQIKAVIDAQLDNPTIPAPQPQPEPQPTPEPTQVQGSMDDDPVLGSEDAEVVLIEWSDFQCPFCGRFYTQTLPSIKTNYVDTGKIRFVYRDFPLESIHPQATPAAEAAECADDQGMFWEFHNLVFENQGSLSVDNYKAWAAKLGLDTSEFNDCVDSRTHQEDVQNDFNDGRSSGVTGTPGFVIGIVQEDGTVVGENIRGAQPYSVFQAAIEKYLAQV